MFQKALHLSIVLKAYESRCSMSWLVKFMSLFHMESVSIHKRSRGTYKVTLAMTSIVNRVVKVSS
jgi:hypothetical protein